ncbi:guanylate kinase [Litorivicinus lipolyticus]|uniref:guanylate kinase n=1 Tax=Litorivicinus lipolyticus TaxID=418701 RepID=UPI003B59D8F2
MKSLTPQGALFVVAAPSGAGKSSLTRALLERMDNLYLSVSHTTRNPRPGEIDGREYHFVDDATFVDMVYHEAFLEHAQVFGFKYRYGTSRAAVELHLNKGHDVLLEIDWQGAQQIKSRMPSAQSIFILPPSREELERRLTGRGTDSAEVIVARMDTSENEIKHWHEFDYLVVNDDFDTALDQLATIVTARRSRTTHYAPKIAPLLAKLLPTTDLG